MEQGESIPKQNSDPSSSQNVKCYSRSTFLDKANAILFSNIMQTFNKKHPYYFNKNGYCLGIINCSTTSCHFHVLISVVLFNIQVSKSACFFVRQSYKHEKRLLSTFRLQATHAQYIKTVFQGM